MYLSCVVEEKYENIVLVSKEIRLRIKMSSNSPLTISARSSRLNSLILNRPESLSKEQKEICSAINREGLLDALFLLYDECSKENLKKRNKNIQEFASKCKILFASSFSQ